MDFKNISTEQFREYTFPGGDKVRIENPRKLNVSASGGHRIICGGGVAHYVPAGWIHITWTVKPGAKEVSF